MDAYNSKTIFHLPGAFEFARGYQHLLILAQENPDIFKDNVVIGSVYGSPNCVWNGGRLVLKPMGREELEVIRDFTQGNNIPVRFTFTNCLLTEEHINDTYGNMLLEMFNDGNNEVICNRPVLENYIRNKYGNRYKYISSTTKKLVNNDIQRAELEKDYHLVVLDYTHNKDMEFLRSIEHKDKCEILVNEVCVPNCPRREEHYKNISQCQLNCCERDMIKCQIGNETFWQVQRYSETFISPEDINNTYLPMGFSNFKIVGRTAHPLDLIEILLYYLIKPQYQAEVRYKLQIAIW